MSDNGHNLEESWKCKCNYRCICRIIASWNKVIYQKTRLILSIETDRVFTALALKGSKSLSRINERSCKTLRWKLNDQMHFFKNEEILKKWINYRQKSLSLYVYQNTSHLMMIWRLSDNIDLHVSLTNK